MNATKTLPFCCLALLSTALSTTAWAQPEETTTLSLTEAALRGPAVASVLDMPRDTPTQQLGAIFTLLDLGEADVAQMLWKDFSRDDLGEETQAALVSKFGAARFLKLARLENPSEDASELAGARGFAESCLEASAKVSSDPKRLAKLISELSSESAEIRQAARSDLAVTGDAGAIACLEALAQATDPQPRTELMLTLARMRPGVEPMLIAAIAGGHGQFRRDVVELSGYLHLQDAIPWLAAIAAGADNDPTVVSTARTALAKMGLSSPSAEEARSLIRSEIWRLETLPVSNENDAIWWSWQHTTPPIMNPGPGKLVSHQHPVATINKLANFRLATVLNAIGEPSEEDRQTELIYWMETIEVSAKAEVLDWEKYSTQVLSETLANALHGDHLAAATQCAAQLGHRADAAALQSMGGKRSALAAALTHSNSEMRYAALKAIMAIKPQQTFAGASGVSPALWHFATFSKGEKQPEHTKQAAAALGWLAELLETGHPYDEMLRDAKRISLTLYQPELTKPTLRVLAVLGTADSQQLLLNFISTDTLPIETRHMASKALATSVGRYGKLLTSDEILHQYDRYNASETADSETQEVLGEVLDLLEK